TEHAQKRRSVAVLLMDLDGFRIRKQKRAFMGGCALGPIEELASPKDSRIDHVIECVSQDKLCELVHEEWRRISGCTAGQVQIGGLEVRLGEETVTKRGHEFPVFTRVRILHSGDVFGSDLSARMMHQKFVMQPDFRLAGLI